MRYKSEKKRKAIIDAARDLFYEKSNISVGMRAISERSGQSLSNIYTYFSGKDEIITVIIENIKVSMRTILSLMITDMMEGGDVNSEKYIKILSREERKSLYILLILTDEKRRREVFSDIYASLRVYELGVNGRNIVIEDEIAVFLSCLTRAFNEEDHMKRCVS